VAGPDNPTRVPGGHLLVASPARIDDACFSVPATRALAAIDGVAGVRVLCSDPLQALWQNLPGIEPIPFPANARSREIAVLLDQVGTGFAAALAWEPGEPADAIRKAGLAARFGPAEPQIGAGFEAVAVTKRPGPVEHRVRDFLLLADALGASPFDPAHFSPADWGVEAQRHSIALVPDSDFGPSHQWPTERWTEVGRELIDHCQLRPTIVGPGKVAEALAEALGDDADQCSPGSLGERLEFFAGHRLVVAADGTAPHLASHVGATCLVLFGPNNAPWRRPLGKRHVLLRRHVACAPCRLADCPLDHRCMDELTTESALAALAGLLDPDH